MKFSYGTTRNVLLIGRWALKFPTFVSWKLFLWGLLGNMQEREFWKGLPNSREMMAPVLLSIPGGFFIAMRRADPISHEEWYANEEEWFSRARELYIPVENKQDNWGKIDGRVVAVDYGSNYKSSYAE